MQKLVKQIQMTTLYNIFIATVANATQAKTTLRVNAEVQREAWKFGNRMMNWSVQSSLNTNSATPVTDPA